MGITTVSMEETLHHLGCKKPFVNNETSLPTLTGERGLSEPSTVSTGNRWSSDAKKNTNAETWRPP